MTAARLNEKLADLMATLSSIMSKKGEPFRARAYSKAEETIMSFTDITDIEQLRGKPGIGDTIMEKLKEFMETGTLTVIEREKENPENIFTNVYGIGPKTAKDLVAKNIRNIEDLREKQDEVLNDVQKMGLKYYEDILERIPRSEIDDYLEMFTETFDIVADTDSKFEIVGSYRRGAATSGDIDVIITSESPEVFINFLDLLIKNGVILEVLSRGKTKSLVIMKLPGRNARRVDFLYTSHSEYPFSVLYFTGSKAFNTVMRGHTLKLGYTMNEHGIAGKSKSIDIKRDFENEKDIFEFLGLKYKEPAERIDGRAVIKKDGSPVELLQAYPVLTEGFIKEKAKKTKKVREPQVDKVPKTKKIREPKEPQVPKEPKTKKVREPKEKKPKAQKTKKVKQPNEPKEPKEKLHKKITSNIEETMENIENFRTNGISVLDSLNENQLSEMIVQTNAAYYNKKPLLTDNQYDIIKEYIERKYPKNEAILQVGAPIEKNKVKLPYEMPSMDKIKPDTNALQSWVSNHSTPYVLSCKLDGVSGMYSTEGGNQRLYTRGDGKVGQDITHLVKRMKLPNHKDMVVRGEFIIPKEVFEKKYKSTFANPRNLVAGIVNSKTIDDKINDLHFVAYEIIKPIMKPSEQMIVLRDLRHEVVLHQSVEKITNEYLSETLLDWRKNYEYEIDGVIVTEDKIHPRKSGNPEYAFAFKMVISDQMAEAKVVDVIWTASKSGYLKPRVRIEPIKLGGVTIEYATGFNGKFIEDNKIGIGAVIQLIRSGDVIPYIKSVTTSAEQAKMPNVPYVWTDTHVDILLENVGDDPVVLEKNITAFFVHLEVDGLSSGNIKRIIKAGFKSISRILHMTKSDFEKVEGFKEKMIEKVYHGIRDKVAGASLIQIMAASNMLGRGLGEKKITPIMNTFPNIMTSRESAEQKIAILKTIDGIGPENANTFVSNIPVFMAFLKDCELEGKLQSATNTAVANTAVISLDTSNALYGKKIVMTKVRDKEIIEHLKTVGATLEDNIKKDVFVLIVKSHDDVSNKTKFADENKIPISTPEEFKEKYM